MRRSARRSYWYGVGFATALYLSPVAIAKLAFQSSWGAIAIAYAIWLSALLLTTLYPGNGSWRVKAGWAFGLGMFFTIPAVLTLLLLMNEVAGIG